MILKKKNYIKRIETDLTVQFVSGEVEPLSATIFLSDDSNFSLSLDKIKKLKIGDVVETTHIIFN